jgi:hypothetical protein
MIDKGFFLDVEPVAVVPLSNTAAVHQAFAETIARGNPKVPIPKPPEYPPPVVLKYAGVKSWATFARKTSTWAVYNDDDAFRIRGYVKDPTGGWAPDDKIETFPLGTAVSIVIDRMIEILQTAATR